MALNFFAFSSDNVPITEITGRGCGVKDGYKVTFGGRVYPGITKSLKKRFYPDYKFKDGTSSIRNGITAHRQLDEYTKCGGVVKRKCKSFKKALATLKSHRFKPILTEVPVVTSKLSTRLDMICLDETTQHNMIISYKSGSERKRRKKREPTYFKAPLDSVELNMTNIDGLQSCMELAILKFCYDLDFRQNYFILRNDVLARPPSWARDLAVMKAIFLILHNPT